MIDRYRREIVENIFTDENKFKAYLLMEIYTLEAWSELGVIPKEDVDKVRENANFSVERIKEIEQETRHDIVAFTRCVSEYLGEEKKWVHYGLTSTDVVDTANGYLYKLANDILFEDLLKFQEVLRKQALRFEKTPCIGRTHGIHADITSFGLKWALWFDEFSRHLERFKLVRDEVEMGKISGAVGNFANTPPFVQDYVCEKLGINSANISTQTLQRDRHANYMAELALIGSSMEKIAVEIRHLQRTEVRELEEFFRKGQKGSSAMPHKRNPISSENIAGCSRVLRGYMLASYENIPLWHERDISHSAVERIIVPDAIMLLDYMLNRYTKVLENITVFEDRMLKNIYITNGVIFSQRILSKLIEKGLSREVAYDTVQPLSMKSWENGLLFKELLLDSKEINEYLSKEEIEESFDISYFLKNVRTIFERVGIV
ncbi:Adenylosuccinate lyase [Candidatus Izimaplasma bacterium HR1]|jgi:adenylosuccinate lyase|uniref:adenylosuccinate lyase n=1 Tax=Candidatus Izimoplasma sp. HR1 TaxID=1541959 RepID=UPI0004F933FF|nr:Adenylosuccinate lyase [Candidatus Izimaplasma bacterium HR1]